MFDQRSVHTRANFIDNTDYLHTLKSVANMLDLQLTIDIYIYKFI